MPNKRQKEKMQTSLKVSQVMILQLSSDQLGVRKVGLPLLLAENSS
jgi:hypothetical protein